jgi:predicted Zn-dependent peptidase
MTEFFHHTFGNGLTLVAEKMGGVRSAAFTLLIPAGAAQDPPGRGGVATMLVDLIFRGAGDRDSRQIMTDLDNLGLQRGEGVETVHTSLFAAVLADNLLPALELYADIIQRPHLPADEVDAVRALALQELQSIDDEPRQKIFIELRKRHYPYPFSRPTVGLSEVIESATHAELAEQHARGFRPTGAILGVAGDIDWPKLLDGVDRLFGGWAAGVSMPIEKGPRGSRVDHIAQDAAQTQIGIAFNTVPYRHSEYFNAQGAVTVLSGGSSSRLFSEVREKRGLCYAVFASYHSLYDTGAVICYAGTTNERAQETLDVTMGEIRRLATTVEPAEVARAQAGLKASLIMQGESTSARSAAVAADWYHLGRVRSLSEMQAAINGLSPKSIMDHLDRHPPSDFTIVTLGPKALEVGQLNN